DSGNFFSVIVIGHTDDGYLSNLRVFVQRVFDLTRVHVVPTTNDEFFQPSDNGEVTVRIESAEVTCFQPTVLKGCGGVFWPVPIGFHYGRAFDEDLAVMVCFYGFPGRIADVNRRAWERRPRSSGLQLAIQIRACGGARRLGEAVPLKNRATECVLERAQYLHRHGRTTRTGKPKFRKVIGTITLGTLQHGVPHGGYSRHSGEAMLAHHLKHGCWFER